MFEIILNVELLEKCIKDKKQIENNDDSILWFIEVELETDVSQILLFILIPILFFLTQHIN